MKKASEKKFTQSERRASEQEQTKSAISDHVARANQIISWEEAKIFGKEHNKKACGISHRDGVGEESKH